MLIKGEGKQIVYRNRREILGITCDVCERELRFPDVRTHSCVPFIKYFEVVTSHQDWGNDSCESVEHYDICQDCIAEFTADYLADCSDTASIDIEAAVICKGQLEWD